MTKIQKKLADFRWKLDTYDSLDKVEQEGLVEALEYAVGVAELSDSADIHLAEIRDRILNGEEGGEG